MKFTHELSGDEGWEKQTYKQPKDFKKVEHLGKCDIDGDMFVAYDTNNFINIFKGTLEEQTLKTNTWYKSDYGFLVYRTGDTNNYCCYLGEEYDDYICKTPETWKESTKNEVKEALVEVAKNKGFKDIHTLKLKTLHDKVTYAGYWEFASNIFNYNLQTNTLTLDAVPIFHNGKWAEILKNDSNESLNEKLESLLDRVKLIEKRLKDSDIPF